MSDETETMGEVARVLGEVAWRRADGTTGEYAGPIRELGHGIPRRDTGPGIRRALFDLAFGYVSGFPVRDILAYVFPGSFREAPVLEATPNPYPAQIAASVPAGQPAAGSAGRGGSGGLGERLRAFDPHDDREWKDLDGFADEADELEAAYRVADAEIARMSEFHDHYRAQVERVRKVADMAAVLAADGRGTPYERALAGRFDETIRAALDGPADALLERIGQVLGEKRATGGPVTGKSQIVGLPEGGCEYLVPLRSTNENEGA